MEIDLQVYTRLCNYGILESTMNTKIFHDTQKVILDKQSTIFFENGVAIGRYLLIINKLIKKSEQEALISEDKIASMKAGVKASAKLYNWNILIKELDKLGIEVDADTKSLIVAGDTEFICEVLQQIYNYELHIADEPNHINKAREPKPSDGVDIMNLDVGKELMQTENWLEFVLISLWKNFNLEPMQAAGLLTNANQYLNQAIIKGLKDRYEMVVSWYEDLYANSKHLCKLIEQETGNPKVLPMMANIVKPGIISRSTDVASWAWRLLSKMGYEFSNLDLASKAWDWFVDEANGGLKVALEAVSKHQDLLESIIPIFIQFARYNFTELFTHYLKRAIETDRGYMNTMNEFVGPLSESKQSKEELLKSGVLDFWISFTIKFVDRDSNLPSDDRMAAVSFISEIWALFPSQVEDNEDTWKSVLNTLKRWNRDKFRPLKLVSLGQWYRLLDQFAVERDAYAPVLYKLLIFSLIENHKDLLTREYMMRNMISVIDKHPTIPIGTLIEPLVKQLHESQGISYLPNLFDFEFFVTLGRHSKLQLKHGILLMDLCAKIYLSDLDWASACQVPFLIIASRFIMHLPIREFFKQFFFLAFRQLPFLEKGAKQDLNMIEEETEQEEFQDNMPAFDKSVSPDVIKSLPPFGKRPNDAKVLDANRRIKVAYIIDIGLKVLEMRNYGISEDIKTLALETNKIWIERNKKNNKGLMRILQFFGEAEHIVEEYMYDFEKEARERELKRRQKENEMEKETQRQKSRSRRRSIESLNDSLLRGTNSDLSEFNSQLSAGQMFERHEKKMMKESRSEFSLMEKRKPQPVKPIENFSKPPPHTQKVKPLKATKINSNASKISKIPQPTLRTHRLTPQPYLTPSSRSPTPSSPSLVSTPLSRSSSSTHFPPISRKPQQTESKSSRNSRYPSKSQINKKGFKTDTDTDNRKSLRKHSDGTLSLAMLKSKRREVKVKSLSKVPKNKIEERAFREIQKLDKRNRKKKYIEKYEKGKRKVKDERQKVILQDELERRKLALGIVSTNEYMDGFKQIVFDIGDPEIKRYEKLQKKIKKEVELYDFDGEEERDRLGVVLYIKKYSKLIKFLFKRYANSGHSLKDVSNFDNAGKKAQTINVAELWKLLKDHGVDPKDMKQKEIQSLVKLVSTKMMRRSDLQVLDYNGYVQFLLQVSHILYTREPYDLSHLPSVEHIKELIKRFRNAAKSRGENMLLYEDPDITNNLLPDGYHRVLEKDMKLYYELPEYYEIEESEKIWIELMDEWLNAVFGFHFLEPIARFEMVTKVRPLPISVKQIRNPKFDEINPLSINENAPKKRAKSRRLEIKPQLPTNLKLLVAKAPIEERVYVNEVAEVLEEILQAFGNGLSHLPPREETRVGNILNRIKKEELLKKETELLLKAERDK